MSDKQLGQLCTYATVRYDGGGKSHQAPSFVSPDLVDEGVGTIVATRSDMLRQNEDRRSAVYLLINFEHLPGTDCRRSCQRIEVAIPTGCGPSDQMDFATLLRLATARSSLLNESLSKAVNRSVVKLGWPVKFMQGASLSESDHGEHR